MESSAGKAGNSKGTSTTHVQVKDNKLTTNTSSGGSLDKSKLAY